MLTTSQSTHYGYRSVHDLPTPPSSSRFSPPLTHQAERKYIPAIPRRSSPPSQPMSSTHRGLPPPAAMSMSQQPLQSSGPQPPPLHPPSSGPPAAQSHPPPPFSPPRQAQTYAQFPSAPSWQHVSEETMRAYLAAKGEEEKRRQEEEKRRQEEEKTRQATLLLDQRRTEHDILQSSLQGGIPPPMVPFVFAGMGGGVLPQAAIEWAHQYIQSQLHQSQTPALLPPGQISASPRREAQAQGYGTSQYPGPGSAVPSTPGSAQGQGTWYPGSPARSRGQSLSNPWPARQAASSSQNVPSLETSFPVRGGGDDRRPTQGGTSSGQQQEQAPSLYFHHWQPPATQSSRRDSGTDQPGPSPKKRKTSVSQPAPPPLPLQGARLSHPPPGRRGGHSRQRSDIGTYRPYASRLERQEGYTPMAGSSTYATAATASLDAAAEAGSASTQPQTQRSGAHPVSSLLADDNPSPAQTFYSPRGAPDVGSQLGGGGRRSPSAHTPFYSPRGASDRPGQQGVGRRGSPDEATRATSQRAHEPKHND